MMPTGLTVALHYYACRCHEPDVHQTGCIPCRRPGRARHCECKRPLTDLREKHTTCLTCGHPLDEADVRRLRNRLKLVPA